MIYLFLCFNICHNIFQDNPGHLDWNDSGVTVKPLTSNVHYKVESTKVLLDLCFDKTTFLVTLCKYCLWNWKERPEKLRPLVTFSGLLWSAGGHPKDWPESDARSGQNISLNQNNLSKVSPKYLLMCVP